MKTIIRIVIDSEIPSGQVHYGWQSTGYYGSEVDLGREILIKVLRVHDEEDASALKVDIMRWHRDDIEIEHDV